eukprot:572746-Rhodomonas_salina.3
MPALTMGSAGSRGPERSRCCPPTEAAGARVRSDRPFSTSGLHIPHPSTPPHSTPHILCQDHRAECDAWSLRGRLDRRRKPADVRTAHAKLRVGAAARQGSDGRGDGRNGGAEGRAGGCDGRPG